MCSVVRWLVAGALAAIGGYAGIVQLVVWLAPEDVENWLGYSAHAGGAILAGIVMQRLVPTRGLLLEPILTGLAVVAVMAVLAYGPPEVPWIGRRAGAGGIALLAAICAACTCSGALAVAPRIRSISRAAVALLALLLSLGCWYILQHVAPVLGIAWGTSAIATIGCYAAGAAIATAIAQWAVPDRSHVRPCTLGAALAVVPTFLPHWRRLPEVPLTVCVGLFVVLASAWFGSQLPALQARTD